MGWSSCIEEGEPGGGLPPGEFVGDILFWDGDEWVANAQGTPDAGDALVWDGSVWQPSKIVPQAVALVGVPNTTILRAMAATAVAGTVVVLLGTQQGLFWFDAANGVDNDTTRFNDGGIGSNEPGWERIL